MPTPNPQTKNYPEQNPNTAEAEKPCTDDSNVPFGSNMLWFFIVMFKNIVFILVI